MNKICEINECTACRACVAKCPVNAIYMAEDALEREIAVIDDKKCIHCNLCVNVCPNNKKLEFHTPLKCLAMRTKDESIKMVCSSGGIASTFGKYIVLNERGVYFGAKKFPVCIVGCKNEKEVLECSGSKYTESSTKDSYFEVKEYLENGEKVVYVGTPCQCAGLLSYLGRDYETLVTVDLVCHGVPPKRYLQDYLKDISKKCAIENVSFRNGQNFRLEIKNMNDVVWSSDSFFDPYYNLFFKGTTFRENCFECKYARKERISDFTIGDFWGIDKETLQYKYDGNISLCFINTNKGQVFFDKIKGLFVYEEREVEEAVLGNEQLCHPFKKDENLRSRFEKSCIRKGSRFAIMTSKFGKEMIKHNLRVKIKQILHI